MNELGSEFPVIRHHLTKRIFIPTQPRPWDQRKRTRKIVAIPNKSMTISKIVERFTKGLDAGVGVVPTSNHPDSEVDYERLSRMDRVEKAFTAEELRLDNEANRAKLNEELRRTQEELDEDKKARIKAKKEATAKKSESPPGDSAKA